MQIVMVASIGTLGIQDNGEYNKIKITSECMEKSCNGGVSCQVKG